MPKQAESLIHVSNLCKSYGDNKILKDVSFDIESGDLVSLIGPSGCGKSTLLRCLNCLEVLDEGEITIDGVCLRAVEHEKNEDLFWKLAHDLRQNVGMVFQEFNLFPHKTLLENVSLAQVIVKKENPEKARDLAMMLLGKVGLKKFSGRYPWSLSGGQKQRAAIARALAMKPKVMLYDEPTSSLDPEMVEEVLQVMRDLDQEGMTQIIVTHEMRFAKDASDYIIYVENGEIVEISDEDEIFINPQDERTRRFLKRYM
ncbi:MAG: amino acid ABC transporter ATP-binding protein [Puniceicoccales bacterium]|jgi:polar amino acid transport system ATP-binding protein|nr:amino acid ABC transporter ATP-binding protein [Puniceicoccales bacterium]